MPFFDMPLDQLRTYQPPRNEPVDFDHFWKKTLADAREHALNPKFTLVDSGLRTVDTYDVTFSGFGGQPIKGWFLVPKHHDGQLPCVVEYIGYGGGRGLVTDRLLWSAAGYAHFIMDTRGQGSVWSKGDTPDLVHDDLGGQFPGFMTRGIYSPETYYYRRVFVDAVRAVEAARSHGSVDPTRVAVHGGSQGGGISLAVAGLVDDLMAVMPNVPFLCHYRRATEITSSHPYEEISRFLRVHRDAVDSVFETLSYFDGVNFAARAQAPTMFSAGLMDLICPPSTVFAAYNAYAGKKEIALYPYNDHEGGGSQHDAKLVRFLHTLIG